MSINIYKEILKSDLNRILNLYDLNLNSGTYGYGDREFWGWKIKDFANGSMQGGVHTLAVAIKLGLMEDERFVLRVIDAAIMAIDSIRAKNGSMVEAYPGESSFCVTALLVFDVLSALKQLGGKVSGEKIEQYLEVIRPLVRFISKNDEEHGVISNHLATAVAALALWKTFTGEGQERYEELQNIIYDNQSEEGWYREYEGADPGYQTLCTYYLFCAYEETKDQQLLDSLNKSLEFLKYFVHPDGTIGGLYGSRNTEVYYPGGIVGLARYSETAAIIAYKLGAGIESDNNLLPQCIDIGNYVPLLNSYAVAALSYKKDFDSGEMLPFENRGEWTFPESGVFIKSTKSYYAIVNYIKGGTIKVFDKRTSLLDCEDGGLFGELRIGTNCSTQVKDPSVNFKNKMIKAGFYKINSSQPTPFTTIILRILALTIFRSTYLGNLFKKMIVKMLMTGKERIDGCVTRQFQFDEESITVREYIQKPAGCVEIRHGGKSSSIHMASSGYYMKPHEQLIKPSKIVTFVTSSLTPNLS